MSENNTLHTLQLWTRSAAAEATAHSRRYSKHSDCLIALACVRALALACVCACFLRNFVSIQQFFFFFYCLDYSLPYSAWGK